MCRPGSVKTDWNKELRWTRRQRWKRQDKKDSLDIQRLRSFSWTQMRRDGQLLFWSQGKKVEKESESCGSSPHILSSFIPNIASVHYKPRVWHWSLLMQEQKQQPEGMCSLQAAVGSTCCRYRISSRWSQIPMKRVQPEKSSLLTHPFWCRLFFKWVVRPTHATGGPLNPCTSLGSCSDFLVW